MRVWEMFERLASVTWHSIYQTQKRRIQYSEDVITAVNLFTISSARHGNVEVNDLRNGQERATGADFELWIQQASKGWYRYALQAKKVAPTGKYNKLAHTVGNSRQIDLLSKYAATHRALALYCFYNYSTQPRDWNCNLDRDCEQLGCSVTPASVVKEALNQRGARNFSWIHERPETLPWRCLVRCPRLVFGPDLQTPWGDASSFYHPQLPDEIRELRERQQSEDFEPSFVAEGYANPPQNNELEWEPSWIIFIDAPPELPDLGLQGGKFDDYYWYHTI